MSPVFSRHTETYRQRLAEWLLPSSAEPEDRLLALRKLMLAWADAEFPGLASLASRDRLARLAWYLQLREGQRSGLIRLNRHASQVLYENERLSPQEWQGYEAWAQSLLDNTRAVEAEVEPLLPGLEPVWQARLPYLRGQITQALDDSRWAVLWESAERASFAGILNLGTTAEWQGTRPWLEVGTPFHLIEPLELSPNEWTPGQLILYPDYLVDVTKVASWVKAGPMVPLLTAYSGYLPKETSRAMLLGVAVNELLDQALQREASEPIVLKEFLRTWLFAEHGLALSVLFPDETDSVRNDLQHFVSQLTEHLRVLQGLVLKGFQKPDRQSDSGPGSPWVQGKDCLIEPTFYSALYGVQGRLDLLYVKNAEAQEFEVFELKSGRTSRSDRPWDEHHAQAWLYLALLQSVYGPGVAAQTYILYSSDGIRPLRKLVRNRPFENTILDTRNALVATELAMSHRPDAWEQIRELAESNESQPFLAPYTREDLIRVHGLLDSLNPLERHYLQAFTQFVFREKLQTRLGEPGSSGQGGLAQLWTLTLAAKQAQLQILTDLRFVSYDLEGSERDAVLWLEKGPESEAWVNFRSGDMLLLYPWEGEGSTLLQSQVVKCTLDVLSEGRLRLVLRNPQLNRGWLESQRAWALEPDSMDSSFDLMQASLFRFMQAPADFRNLILGQRVPRQASESTWVPRPDLSEEQNRVLAKAWSAPEYFLLVGPPGTGKTSYILKNLVEELLARTTERLLLMAYTNRAVDEICQQLEKIGTPYFRVGSRLSTDEAYRPRLLNAQLRPCTTRLQLREVLQGHRVVVGTLASLSGRTELFRLLSFDRLLVDEASQILEPQLVGMLARVPRFVLIGDHKQLPAVVTQSVEQSATSQPELQAIGLENRRNSLFERLYRQCQHQQATWAYDTLTRHGRMHADIAEFVSHAYYEGCLVPATSRQTQTFQPYLADLSRRMLFIPSGPQPEGDASHKQHSAEARLLARWLVALAQAYPQESPETFVGVIATFRNQIVTIRQWVEQESQGLTPAQKTWLSRVSIDTVERYQGSQRDLILVSLGINRLFQLESLVSWDVSQTVDRKLNVILSRAREQVVLLGNPSYLEQAPSYAALLAHIRQQGGYLNRSVEDFLG